ncbi:MAG: phage portal protein [Pseudomonadota bacterium]
MKFWPSKKTPPVEEKATSTTAAPDQWLLELFAQTSAQALTVSTSEALTVPAVSSAIRLISEAVASLRPTVMVEGDDGLSTPNPSHPVGRMLRGQVSDWSSGFEFTRDLVAQALIQDSGGLAYVNRTGNGVAELVLYDAGNITAERFTDGTGAFEYKLAGQVIPARDVIHLRSNFSRSPLSLAKEAIAVAKAMETHANKLFANGARPGGVIETPEKFGEESLKKIRAGWAAAHEGSANAGKTAVLWSDATFKPITFNSVDAQFLELRTFQTVEIARAFRVPPSMIYEMGRATWSNSEQAGREFLTFTLEPWLRALEAALTRSLFTETERGTHRVHFERDDLTRASLGDRATAYSSLIASRVLNPNEARALEGKAPYEGGDAFANPNTGSSQPGAESVEERALPPAEIRLVQGRA